MAESKTLFVKFEFKKFVGGGYGVVEGADFCGRAGDRYHQTVKKMFLNFYFLSKIFFGKVVIGQTRAIGFAFSILKLAFEIARFDGSLDALGEQNLAGVSQIEYCGGDGCSAN